MQQNGLNMLMTLYPINKCHLSKQETEPKIALYSDRLAAAFHEKENEAP
jgi:hypothetical protein